MTSPSDLIQPSHSKLLVTAGIALAAVFGALYLFVHTIIFSHTGNVLDLYVPSRYGSDTFVLDAGEFAMLHWIAFAALVAEIFLAAMFFRQNQSQVGSILIISMTVLVSFYTAVILGNVLNEEWGGMASTLGVIGVILVGIAVSFTLVMKLLMKKPAKKG